MAGAPCIKDRPRAAAKRLQRRAVQALDLAINQHRRKDGDEIVIRQIHRADQLVEVVHVNRPTERRFLALSDLEGWEIATEPELDPQDDDDAWLVDVETLLVYGSCQPTPKPVAAAAAAAPRHAFRNALPAGIHDGIPAERYHRDPCDRPALTAGTIKTLLAYSPWHAWHNHPRLNPEWAPTYEAKFDTGTAAHALLLQGDDVAQWIDADDWRTKAARDERDQARKEGKVPLLAKQRESILAMVTAVRQQLATFDAAPPLLADGKAEQTLIWEEDGVCCRARTDWLRTDGRAIDDLKTSSQSASPHEWPRRTFWSIGCDVQAVWYQRGVKALTGRKPAFRFVVVETAAPYAVSVFDLAPSTVALAERKIEWALRTWRQCLERNEWPGYDQRVASVELNSWQEIDFIERAGADAWPEEIAA